MVSQSRDQCVFNDKIETEQTKLMEELNQLQMLLQFLKKQDQRQ